MHMLKEAPAINRDVLWTNHAMTFVVAPSGLLLELHKNVVDILSCFELRLEKHVTMAVLRVCSWSDQVFRWHDIGRILVQSGYTKFANLALKNDIVFSWAVKRSQLGVDAVSKVKSKCSPIRQVGLVGRPEVVNRVGHMCSKVIGWNETLICFTLKGFRANLIKEGVDSVCRCFLSCKILQSVVGHWGDPSHEILKFKLGVYSKFQSFPFEFPNSSTYSSKPCKRGIKFRNTEVCLKSLESCAAVKEAHISNPLFWAFFCYFLRLSRWWTFRSFKNGDRTFADNAQIQGEQNKELMQRRLEQNSIDVSLHKIVVVGVRKVRLRGNLIHHKVTIYRPSRSFNRTGFSVQEVFNSFGVSRSVDLALGDVLRWGGVALEPDPHLKNDQDSCHV